MPEAPGGDFAEAEGVPPKVEHGLVEIENAGASDALRRWNKCGEAGVDLRALGSVGAGEKMPKRQSIVRARFGENRRESGLLRR